MSSQNPRINSSMHNRAAAISSTFTLPPLPTTTTTPENNNNALLLLPPVAATYLKLMLKAQEQFVSDTEPSIHASLKPTTTTSTSKTQVAFKPQPPAINHNRSTTTDNTNNNSSAAALRSALVREAARFVEDPDSYRDSYKRVYEKNHLLELERQQQQQQQQHEKERNKDTRSQKQQTESATTNSTSTITDSKDKFIWYDKEYEEKMRNFILRKSNSDGHSNLEENRRIQQSLNKNNQRDHQAFLASQRKEIEDEEVLQRKLHLIDTFDETRALLLSRGAALIDEFFEDALLNTESNERRERLALEIEQYKTTCALKALFVSNKFLLTFAELYRQGIEGTAEVMSIASLDTFTARRQECSRTLQRVGRAYLERLQAGKTHWNNNVGKEQINNFFHESQVQFEQTQLALKNRFQLHSVESFEQYCRRVILEQAVSGLETIHFKSNQTQIILGEYDNRRKILVSEEKELSNQILREANGIRYDLHHVINARLKFGIQKRYEQCEYIRRAVDVLQNKFFRPCLRGEFGLSFSKTLLQRAVQENVLNEPIRPLAKLNRALRKEIQSSENGHHHHNNNQPTSNSLAADAEHSAKTPVIGKFIVSEEFARGILLRKALNSLSRLYTLCFDEAYSYFVGCRREQDAIFDEEEVFFEADNNSAVHDASIKIYSEAGSACASVRSAITTTTTSPHQDERWIETKPKYEIFIQDTTRFNVEMEYRFCRSVNKFCCLPTRIENRPAHLSFFLPFPSSNSNNNIKINNWTWRRSNIYKQFLSEFVPLTSIEHSEIQWYRLRGAVDVSALIAEAFAVNQARSHEIYARTIGMLIRKRRATSAEIRKETLTKLKQQALERLSVELEEWNTRWIGCLEMLQQHSYLLLNLDWQRKWISLREFCEEDEVATLQYLATQNYDQYKKDVSEFLRGVHSAAITSYEEKHWVPRFAKKRRQQQQQQKEQLQVVNNNKNNFNIYDESDEEEEQNIDFWQHLLENHQHQQQAQQQQQQETELLNMYDDEDDDDDPEDSVLQTVVVDDEEGDDDEQQKAVVQEKLRFYQNLYGASSDDENDEIF